MASSPPPPQHHGADRWDALPQPIKDSLAVPASRVPIRRSSLPPSHHHHHHHRHFPATTSPSRQLASSRRVPPSPHRLYVGNLAASLDLPLLRELRITHVVQVLEEDWSPHAAAGIAYLPIVVEDSPTVDLAQHFRRSIRFAASAWGCCDCRGCLGLSDASAAAVTADAGSHGCAYCNNVADDNGIHGDDVLDKGNDGVVNDDDDDKGDDDDDTSAGVLVHCQMGSSRSGAVAAALLMWLLRLPASAAVDTVRAARPCVNPNDGFLCQLANFEVALGLRVAHEAAA